jgi:hypothetical protein
MMLNPYQDWLAAVNAGPEMNGPHALLWAAVTAGVGMCVAVALIDDEQPMAFGMFAACIAGLLWPVAWLMASVVCSVLTAITTFRTLGRIGASFKRRLHD